MRVSNAIGLMSGTSHDGVDVALIDTDGEEIGRLGPTFYRPYAEEERQLIRRAMAQAANLADRSERPLSLADAEALVTQSHAEAVERLLAANGMQPADVGVVGLHGQTVLHDPGRRLTVQLGSGPALALNSLISLTYPELLSPYGGDVSTYRTLG